MAPADQFVECDQHDYGTGFIYKLYNAYRDEYLRWDDSSNAWITRGADLLAIAKANERPQWRMRYDHEKFWIPGRVFKAYWHEPYGMTSTPTSNVSVSSNGSLVHSKERIFVVIRDNQNRSSQCLAVVSHGRQGVAIAKAVKAHYAIIYSGSREPQPQPAELPKPGELGMKESIRMKLQSQRDQLDPMSRIHLMVSYPIHHNIEVYNMGMIHPDSLNVLFAAYLAVNFPGGSSS